MTARPLRTAAIRIIRPAFR